MEEHTGEFPLQVEYDSEDDTLTFNFVPTPEKGIAEEAADEIWVRYDPETRHILTVDVLNFSKRVREVFGSNLLYAERTDPERIESLVGLPLASEN